jgi:hypothetical protein
VLLAFAVIVVWEKFNQAEGAAAKEATAGATIIRLSQGIDPEHGAALRKATLGYLTTAIARDWPALEHGRVSAGATEALGMVYIALLKLHSIDSSEGLVISEILR